MKTNQKMVITLLTERPGNPYVLLDSPPNTKCIERLGRVSLGTWTERSEKQFLFPIPVVVNLWNKGTLLADVIANKKATL
jgi:hypothetical protein